MDLWIRSQDKNMLMQAKEVKTEVFIGKKIYSPNTHKEVITFDGDDKFYVIRVNNEPAGEYETEERFREILDEIQKLIIDSDKTLLTTSSFLDKETYDEILKEIKYNKFNIVSCENAQLFPLNTTIAYQMPER